MRFTRSRASSALGVTALPSSANALATLERRCARPLCWAQEASLRTRSVSPKRAALLAERAAAMRAAPSAPELLLWNALSNRKLGVAFRRQVPLAGYVADFVCASCKLVVEVDGSHHARRARADARRDACLALLGYRVLRLDAQLVMRSLSVALGRVRQALAAKG